MSETTPDSVEGTEVGHVSEEEIVAAMGVNSLPDQVRLTSADPDETGQTMDATGGLRPAAPETPTP